MILLFPTLIEGITEKKARDNFKPTAHMFYKQRVVDFDGDGVTKWAGLDNKSDLLDDHENVLVKFDEGMKEDEMDEKKRKALDGIEKEFPESARKEKEMKM